MEWLMAELVKNPRVMKKVQEEVRRVVGKKSKIDMEDINQMSYFKCVIKENLRLHPPVALLVPRETSTSVEMGGYHIPAKAQVFKRVSWNGIWASTEYVIANLLYWFDWKLPGGALGEDLDMSEAHGLTVSKKLPFHLLPTPYSP
ncbi:hypothetical protein FNV43_RR19508 [Rhamnella rubrinervis]|uniref:Cytochrome P450 n=1 Tax=Rhamnella rubrinervis TaxID=2594499 RepID=A0A8K0DST4_9ROSA|nr:hypothetical protein FNV43_RR19508 [Rhamnella rubrinervis]